MDAQNGSVYSRLTASILIIPALYISLSHAMTFELTEGTQLEYQEYVSPERMVISSP